MIPKETIEKIFDAADIVEVINDFVNLKKVVHNLSFCKKDIKKYNPDVIIYVDFPGFNLRPCTPASIAATELIKAKPLLLCACKPIGPLNSFLRAKSVVQKS